MGWRFALGTEEKMGRGEIPREGVAGSSWPLPTATLLPGAGGYLPSVLSGMPASIRVARNCMRTPRMLLMKPLESGKRGKPMSG